MLILWGGFPEVFASELAKNITMIKSLKKAINSGIFTYAECGGMMYLSEKIIDFESKSWEMVGVLPNIAMMDKKLTLGYREGKILIKNKLFKDNIILKGHEFHRGKNYHDSNSPIIEIKDYYTQQILSYQGWQIQNIYASYLHIHFANIIPQIKILVEAIL